MHYWCHVSTWHSESFVHLTENSLCGEFISIVVSDVYIPLEATAVFRELDHFLSSTGSSHALRCYNVW